jgi:hypothetical protein
MITQTLKDSEPSSASWNYSVITFDWKSRKRTTDLARAMSLIINASESSVTKLDFLPNIELTSMAPNAKVSTHACIEVLQIVTFCDLSRSQSGKGKGRLPDI